MSSIRTAAALADELEQSGVIGREDVDLFAAVAAQQSDHHAVSPPGANLPDGPGVLPTLQICNSVHRHAPTIPPHGLLMRAA